MYLKFVSPFNNRAFKLCRVTDGSMPTLQSYADPDELPDREDEGDDYEFVDWEGGRVKTALFLPDGTQEFILVATSGELYVQDDTGSTMERVR